MQADQLSMEVAAYVAIINGSLMPNRRQMWLRWWFSNLDGNYFTSSASLLPSLLMPLHTYIQRIHASETVSQRVFLYTNMLQMLANWCPPHIQKEIVTWLTQKILTLESNNLVTPPT